jgi:hypothetical protein
VAKRTPQDDDRDLIREGLRAVLRSEGNGSRAVAAKAQAARQLALLNGEPVLSTNGKKPVDPDEIDAPNPMLDLEVAERARRQLQSKGRRTAYRIWCDAWARGDHPDDLDALTDELIARYPEGGRRPRRVEQGSTR